ncbi:MAG: S8 family serine peptidase [Candidatus Krumholzibacteriota bacterium]|nr:S8 family serine peptidase [Candidatus Krumholzibacteriota bacterium]
MEKINKTSLCLETHDPLWPYSWGKIRIGVEKARAITEGDSSVVVAVIDTGCDLDHPDLMENLWINIAEAAGLSGIDDDGNGYVDDLHGYDFVSATEEEVAAGEDPGPPDPIPDDIHGHGTHISGIISSRAGNGIGTEGIAPRCRLMILRAGYKRRDGAGELKESDICEALDYAVENGADIINMSFGGSYSGPLYLAVKDASDAGVIIIASSGNNGSDEPVYPGAFDECLAVGAVDRNDLPAIFSGYGGWTDCAAPGISILSTEPGGLFGYRSGTSVAAPFVSGTAALLKSSGLYETSELIKNQILNTAENISTPGLEEFTGAGLVRADLALEREPGIKVSVAGYLCAEYSGDGDGVVEGGETAMVTLTVKNVWREITSASLTVDTGDPYISIVSEKEFFIGDMTSSDETAIDLRMAVAEEALAGQAVSVNLSLDCDQGETSIEFMIPITGKITLERTVIGIRELSGDGDGGAGRGERIACLVGLKDHSGELSVIRGSLDISTLGGETATEWEYAVFDSVNSEATLRFEFEIGEIAEAPLSRLRLEVEGPGLRLNSSIPLWISYAGDPGMEGEGISCQGGTGHTGFFYGSAEPPLEKEWESGLDGEGSLLCQPLVAGTRVFVSRREGEHNSVYSISLADGSIVWKRELPGISESGARYLAWFKGVLFASCGRYLHAIDQASSEIVWSAGVEEEAGNQTSVAKDPVVHGNKVFVAFHDRATGGIDRVCAFDPFTGRKLWEDRPGEGDAVSPFPPAGSGDLLVYSTQAGILKGIHASTGAIEWMASSGGALAAPMICHAGRLVTISSTGILQVLALEDGSSIWRSDFDGALSGPACVDIEKGVIFFMATAPPAAALYAAEMTGGRILSRKAMEGYGYSGVSISEGRIYCPGAEGRIEIFGMENPEGLRELIPEWRNDSGGNISPVFHHGGKSIVSVNTNSTDMVISLQGANDPGTLPAPVISRLFPNPFNPSVTICFELSSEAPVTIDIYDAGGRLVRSLLDRGCQAGPHEIRWDGKDGSRRLASAGVYFCRLSVEGKAVSRKMILLR